MAEHEEISLWGLRTECPVSGPINELTWGEGYLSWAGRRHWGMPTDYGTTLLSGYFFDSLFNHNPTNDNSIDVQVPEEESIQLV